MSKLGPSQSSLQRTLTTLKHQEPDRVPLFLMLTMHGAKELGLSIREYFSKADYVAEGQARLLAKYRHDCLYSFFYAPLEIEAWGGEVIFRDDGPANSGAPIITKLDQIWQMSAPRVKQARCLHKVLQCIELLREHAAGQVPIIGVVMSPFSLPAMQLGFDRYLELLHDRRETFEHLMRLNQEFTVEWANAQLEAGATAICYFDPVSSPSIIPRDLYLQTGLAVAKNTLSRLKGPAVVHVASGRCLSTINDLASICAAGVAVSCLEDLGEHKALCRNKVTLIGNLNGIEMCRWTPSQAETAVKEAISKAASGGGFILADSHGEIPFQVSDEILTAVAEAAHRWGSYSNAGRD